VAIEVSLEKHLQELEQEWKQCLTGNRSLVEDKDENENIRMEDTASEEYSAAEEKETEDIDGNEEEVYVDDLGHVIGKEAVENSVMSRIHEKGKTIIGIIGMYEAVGSYDEEPDVSDDELTDMSNDEEPDVNDCSA